ncbi:hypothetical protein OVA03_05180 [Asticcacaulis sp. SL142]|uniref:hypothetical protein n=1 Tax=Asticcacaulis sp. SL142 TaxID=2995155 RepID=UPI00226D3C62|nr:hypothetical protein [Asticcacaulis sp. SL142]WAC49303.1 hypothetical protein OVA03_05180 [Asticcacaulis sp. SL142]
MTNSHDVTHLMISPADFVNLYLSSFGLCLTGFQRQSQLLSLRETIAQGRQAVDDATETEADTPPHSFA